MDGDRTPGQRCLQIEREFEGNRLAGRFQAEVYERVVPVRRTALFGGQDGPGGEHEGKPGDIGGHGAGAGGCR